VAHIKERCTGACTTIAILSIDTTNKSGVGWLVVLGYQAFGFNCVVDDKHVVLFIVVMFRQTICERRLVC
jgi:hypothetical protein